MPAPETYPIQEFLNYLTFQKRYSRHTIVSYENDLSAFFDFVITEFNYLELPAISTPVIRTWLATLKENKAAARTINRKISALKSFFRYQLKLKRVASNPAAAINAIKVSKRLPSFIERRDIETLFQHVEFPATWEGATSRLLLQILYNTGVRLSELVNLKEAQIDKGRSSLKVLGKGNKERVIPVSNGLLREMDLYMAAKKSLPGAVEQDVLLVSSKGKKLYAKFVYRVARQYLGMVSTNERKSPHVLRHTFATHLTNNGAEINSVKELLGHSSLASTQVYTSNSIEKLKDVYKLSHPKS